MRWPQLICLKYLLHFANMWMSIDLHIDLDLEDLFDLKIGHIRQYAIIWLSMAYCTPNLIL